MREIANRLMMRQSGRAAALPSAIFGSVGGLAQSLDSRERIRIGLWPLRSSTHAEIAMGLMSIFGLLLERWSHIRVYRVFAQLDGDVETYEWSIGRSQFDVDEWEIDGLDDNVAIWGSLENQDSQWILEFELEADWLDDSELASYTISAPSLPSLIGKMPLLARQMVESLGGSPRQPVAAEYNIDDENIANLDDLLERAFRWELQLLLSLWGRTWDDKDVVAAYEDILLVTSESKTDFGAWLAASILARGMAPIFGSIAEVIVRQSRAVIETFPTKSAPPVVLGEALFAIGHVKQAYDFLEAGIEAYDADGSIRQALGELYWRGGRLTDAADVFQEMIELELASADTCLRYAELLLTMEYEALALENFIFIDPLQVKDQRMLLEAVEAYDAALVKEPERITAIYGQLLQLIELGDARLWMRFERLVNLDQSGDLVRSAIDAMFDMDDLGTGVKIFQKAIGREPERHDLRINLAALLLAGEDGQQARPALEQAKRLTNDKDVLVEIDRLLLSANDSEFEFRIGEITQMIDGGRRLSDEDAEFLERSLEQAPLFGEGYVLLAKGYLSWDEKSAAMEILLDGQKRLPTNPDIAEVLARALWDAGEEALAFECLNNAIAANPNHVALLALTGLFLFEDDQTEEAKNFLARAEAIAPRNLVLQEVRREIAKLRRGD